MTAPGQSQCNDICTIVAYTIDNLGVNVAHIQVGRSRHEREKQNTYKAQTLFGKDYTTLEFY